MEYIVRSSPPSLQWAVVSAPCSCAIENVLLPASLCAAGPRVRIMALLPIGLPAAHCTWVSKLQSHLLYIFRSVSKDFLHASMVHIVLADFSSYLLHQRKSATPGSDEKPQFAATRLGRLELARLRSCDACYFHSYAGRVDRH